MSENFTTSLLTPPAKWQLSGSDDILLNRLHTEVWGWLIGAETPDDLIALGHILQALENLMETGAPPGSGECSVADQVNGADGMCAGLSLSATDLTLSLSEVVWTGDQGHDFGSLLGPDGMPFNLVCTPLGSFDQELFEFWLFHASNASPTHIGDGQQAKASWYGESNS